MMHGIALRPTDAQAPPGGCSPHTCIHSSRGDNPFPSPESHAGVLPFEWTERSKTTVVQDVLSLIFVSFSLHFVLRRIGRGFFCFVQVQLSSQASVAFPFE